MIVAVTLRVTISLRYLLFITRRVMATVSTAIHHSESDGCIVSLKRQQQPAGCFEIPDHIIEEAGCGSAIDEAVIVGKT